MGQAVRGQQWEIRIKLFFITLVFATTLPVPAVGLRIAIDAGHSADSLGATACSGKPEHLFNRELEQLIIQRLTREGHTVIATSGGTLEQRATFAKGTDFLLSLHHDSVQPQFTKRNSVTRGVCTRKASGFSIFVSGLNGHYKESLDLAKRLGSALVARGMQPSLHHAEPIPGENRPLIDPTLGIYRFDTLKLLKLADAPAVLLEAAVITNPDDEKKASSQSYRNNILEAIIETTVGKP